jgi:hypothetical protein
MEVYLQAKASCGVPVPTNSGPLTKNGVGPGKRANRPSGSQYPTPLSEQCHDFPCRNRNQGSSTNAKQSDHNLVIQLSCFRLRWTPEELRVRTQPCCPGVVVFRENLGPVNESNSDKSKGYRHRENPNRHRVPRFDAVAGKYTLGAENPNSWLTRKPDKCPGDPDVR